MSLDVHIVNGTGRIAKVSHEGAVSVQVHPHPPVDEDFHVLPFRQYFTDDGASTGDEDMTVNASAASPQDFWVGAQSDYDVFVKSMAIIVSQAGATLDDFANLGGALTNGVQVNYFSSETGNLTLHEGITTNLEFVRFGLASVGIGGTDAFKADLSGAGADSYLPVVDFAAQFGLTYGMRLRRGSSDQLTFRIQDNLSTVTQFDAIAYGIKV